MLRLGFLIALGSPITVPRLTAPICLGPATAQFPNVDASQASNGVSELFKSYLTGPSLSVVQLTARLTSQAREEAHNANCKFVLFVTAKGERHKKGALGQIAGKAAQEAAWGAAANSSTATKRVASMGAVGAARAATDIAATTRSEDELELSYRLESETGTVLKEGNAKQKAKSDGEDLLTPLVEHAAEEIAAVVSK